MGNAGESHASDLNNEARCAGVREGVRLAHAKTRADAAPMNPKKGAVVSPWALLAACNKLRAAPSMAVAGH